MGPEIDRLEFIGSSRTIRSRSSGFRIELGEIETVLLEHESVGSTDSLVVALETKLARSS